MQIYAPCSKSGKTRAFDEGIIGNSYSFSEQHNFLKAMTRKSSGKPFLGGISIAIH